LNKTIDISIVIPLLDEQESLIELHGWIKKVMDEHQLCYELIFIDDGSRDDSWKTIEKIAKTHAQVKGIKFQRNYGKSAALQKGFEAVCGQVIVTMDADLQDSPEEIPELYRMIIEEDFDVVSGWKKKRYDPLSKTIPTKLYNWAARRLSGIYLHDFNCGIKAYKSAVVKSIELYGDMHRYIPVLAKNAGFSKIGEKIVVHQKRKYGTTKFGLNRFVHGPLDLMSIIFMGKFGKKPMHFFGSWGIVMFLIGFSLVFYLAIDKLFIHQQAMKIAERTEFYICITAMIIGVQLFLTGFVAELIGRNSSTRNVYLIEAQTTHQHVDS